MQTKDRDPTRDADWQDLASQWEIRPDTIYLNHGSFGPPSKVVRETRRKFIDDLDRQPMDFYLRQFETLLDQSKRRLATFLNVEASSLALVENATYGMNVVATSFPLQRGDEVVLNNHEYGAVRRIWNRATHQVGAQCVTARLPDQFFDAGEVVDQLLSVCSDRTKLVVVSHITSAPALILPVEAICEAMKLRGIAVCIDGPHAPAQIELDIDGLNCDFYTASCHKGLNASVGTGFLYASPQWAELMQPSLQSWGRLSPAVPEHWTEELIWTGTRDPSGYLSLPTAIDFMQDIGLNAFRDRSRWLAQYGEEKLVSMFGFPTLGRRELGWYGSMAHVRLPEGDHRSLQSNLWERFGIEIPVFQFEGIDYLRLSCHLYNSTEQIDQLVDALRALLRYIRDRKVRALLFLFRLASITLASFATHCFC